MEKIVTISNKRDLKEERKYCKIIKVNNNNQK